MMLQLFKEQMWVWPGRNDVSSSIFFLCLILCSFPFPDRSRYGQKWNRGREEGEDDEHEEEDGDEWLWLMIRLSSFPSCWIPQHCRLYFCCCFSYSSSCCYFYFHCQVAKGASDVVLLDDCFSTIVDAVARGRVIFNNIQKFVVYLFGTNIVQVCLFFLSLVPFCSASISCKNVRPQPSPLFPSSSFLFLTSLSLLLSPSLFFRLMIPCFSFFHFFLSPTLISFPVSHLFALVSFSFLFLGTSKKHSSWKK